MRPPAILTLQLLNALIGAGQYLGFSTATGIWTAASWSPWQIAIGVALANLCYAGLVSHGGRLSDRWGRARTAILGASVCVTGATIALAFATPWSALAAIMLGCAGSALFFPGNVGLFSDARTPDGVRTPALHVKVSRYNLGWSGGNIAGFGLAWAFSLLPFQISSRLSWAVILVLVLTSGLALWRWRSLPPQPPRSEGDRTPHPALSRLTWMGRAALLVYCLMGMAFIGLLTRSLTGAGLSAAEAQKSSTAALFAYGIGYFSMFVFLGAWSGWVLRPWRLLLVQVPILVGAIGLLWLGHGAPDRTMLICVGLLLGLGFGAVYTGSIYYSMRLPEGAAHAAALHETALGIGSTAGPLACGAFMAAVGDGALGSLGLWLVLIAGITIAFQALVIPGAARLGAR